MTPHSTGASPPITTITAQEQPADSSPTRFLEEHGFNPDHLPYWLVNVPFSEWTAECPTWLRDQTPKNIRTLSTLDADYQRQDWQLVREIIRTNRIDQFQRVPTDLRKYLEYVAHIKTKYGSVMRFVVQERLGWGDGDTKSLMPKGRPFEYSEDIRILYNDWPYGIDTDIIHLVVWTKFELPDDPTTGEMTEETYQLIEQYVQETFSSVASEQVIWFRNWKSLKSVHAVEHFHVMLHQPDLAFVREITRGDVPLIERV